MPSSRSLPIAALLGIVVVAHFSLAWQAEKNGTFTLDDVFTYSNRVLPGTSIPIRLPETGIATIDNYFAFMMAFFWMALDERNIRAHLQANYLLGTLSGTWLIMLTEAHRTTSSTTFFVLTYFFELMGEFLGIGLFTPLWCAFHLFWTRSPSADSKRDAEDALAAPTGTYGALGWALVIGHLAPTILMKETSVQGEGLYSAQWWTILRLFHPVFVLAVFTAIKALPSIGAAAGPDSAARRFANKRKILLFSILASAYGHVSTLAVLLAQHWIPNWLRADVLEALDLKTIVFPTPFWFENPVQLVPFLTGVATFLQWDNICAASAISIWATSLYIEALLSSPGGIKVSELINVSAQAAGVNLLAGPVAGAAFILQERDALVVAQSRERELLSKKQL